VNLASYGAKKTEKEARFCAIAFGVQNFRANSLSRSFSFFPLSRSSLFLAHRGSWKCSKHEFFVSCIFLFIVLIDGSGFSVIFKLLFL